MINSLNIYEELQEALDAPAAKKITDIMVLIYEDLQDTVTKSEFGELKALVKDLVDAQRQTGKEIDKLGSRTDKLVTSTEKLSVAQDRTEKRVGELVATTEKLSAAQDRNDKQIGKLIVAQDRTEKRVGELVTKTDKLSTTQDRNDKLMGELIVAQKQTDKQIEELVVAQKQTEKQVGELVTTTQKMTEKHDQVVSELRELNRGHENTKKQLGGLSDNFGFLLENDSCKHLPALLSSRQNVIVKNGLTGGYLRDNENHSIEVDIYGEVEVDGKNAMVIGECKSRLSRNNVDNFLRKKLKRFDGVYDHIIPVIVTHAQSSEGVEAYALQKGVTVYFSRQF